MTMAVRRANQRDLAALKRILGPPSESSEPGTHRWRLFSLMMDAAMSNVLAELRTTDDLDRLLEASSTQPVLIYKHSLTCGTSAMAFEEIRDLVAGPAIGARIGVVMVQPSRGVANEITSRLAVRHETPQVLLVRDGLVVWHASHFRVTADAVRAALERHSGRTPAPQ